MFKPKISLLAALVCLLLGKQIYSIERSIVDHNAMKEIFARALLKPSGTSSVSGTVEFQRLGNYNSNVLVNLANGKAGNTVSVYMGKVRACPTEQSKQKNVLGEVGKIGTTTFDSGGKGEAVIQLNGQNLVSLLGRTVLLGNKQEINLKNSSVIACGIIEKEGTTTRVP